MELREAIARLSQRRDLDELEMAATVGRIMDGEATPGQIGALLVALRMKGETVGEVVGAARAMRARATPVHVPAEVVAEGFVDTCGTGGDGAGTLNISTLAAFVVAACGVRVAKHGNSALSSRAGSADLLLALGVDIAAPVATALRCLRDVGFGFFFAPSFHGATRHAAPVRREIGVRTIFNLLGPLTNPAGPRHQLVGVYAADRIDLITSALAGLGAERALVVHGSDGGLDEFSPCGVTEVGELRGRDVVRYTLRPRDFGVPEGELAGIAGGDAAYNALQARALLDGAAGAARSCVVMTAAAALYVAGANGFRDGARRAERAIDRGDARALLARLVIASHDHGSGNGNGNGNDGQPGSGERA
ncbi:MAG: anthranilate phosphoribosyltransferase [Myxococcales bacterium]|nr:anthranilate phosphoribosyltransferase [Myxococcales bacterium]